jgi:DNA primase
MSNCIRDPFPQRLLLLEYLKQLGWKPSRIDAREEVVGLCPLHRETQPSFYVNRRKQVFFCHGCHRGGGIRQLKAWLEGVSSNPVPDAGRAALLESTYFFYQQQLNRSPQARLYLRQRGIQDPALIERMRIGYAPGASLRGYLLRHGYSPLTLLDTGLIDARNRDRFFRCLIFPLPEAESLYGRSIHSTVWRHHFLPGSKGGLYGWAQAQQFSSLILVEGLFDVAALWQAGFPQAVAALGSHLNSLQMTQLCSSSYRRVHLCFDADENGGGQRAALSLARQLQRARIQALRVELPYGYDPARWFASGGNPCDFQRFLERARP